MEKGDDDDQEESKVRKPRENTVFLQLILTLTDSSHK